jgi:large exoprotein involved in heme utilization and adhesion
VKGVNAVNTSFKACESSTHWRLAAQFTLCLCFLAATVSAHAQLITGAIENGRLVLRDANAATVAQASSPDFFIAPGAADNDANRNLFFLGGMISRQPKLIRTDGSIFNFSLPTSITLDRLGINLASNQVQVLARSNIDQQVHLLRLNAGSGSLTAFNPISSCCDWSGLAGSYSEVGQLHLVVGRTAGSSNDSILQFSYPTATQSAFAISGFPGPVLVMALNEVTNQTFALVQAGSSVQFGRINLTNPATFTALGPALSNAFVGLTEAVVDHGANRFYAVMKLDGENQPRVLAFDLSTGGSASLASQSPAFLLLDGSVVLDGVFRDGFE